MTRPISSSSRRKRRRTDRLRTSAPVNLYVALAIDAIKPTGGDRVENGVEFADDIKYDDFDYIANVARLNSATLATLASAPGQPQKVAVLNPPYDVRTTLRWEKPAGFPAGASFEVVYRDTNQPDWTNVIPAGTDTTIAIPLSKDNIIFGVRSVDAAGRRIVSGS